MNDVSVDKLQEPEIAEDAADTEDSASVLDALLGTITRGALPGSGLYVRISLDRTGAGLGVARQLKAAVELCQRQGLPIFDVYIDNDVSATSRKPRKQWLRMLADIEAGKVDAIVCWHVDRLTRSPRELEQVIDLHDQRGVRLATCTGEIDLATPTGRMVARMLGAAARQEVEHKGERQKEQQRQAAEAGKVHPTGHLRPFGWAAPGDPTIVEDEAEIVRDMATRILAGESRASVARSLNAQGITTTTGREWTVLAVKNLLLQARLSGRREYNPVERGKTKAPLGEIVADNAFPAIITPAQSDQLRAMLTRTTTATTTGTSGGKTKKGGKARKGADRIAGTDEGREPRSTRGQGRTYLYSGILRHVGPDCNTGLRGRIHNGHKRYQCLKEPGRGGCNKVAIRAHLVEAQVRKLICTALERPAFYQRMLRIATKGSADPDKVSKELRAIDAKREELAEAWANDEMTRKEWLAARNRLDARADKLTRQLATNEHAVALLEFAKMEGDVWHRFEALSFGGKRALVQACVDHIKVNPTDPTKPRKVFDPSRIVPEWRV